MEDKTTSSIFSAARSETPDTIRQPSDTDMKPASISKPRDTTTSLPPTATATTTTKKSFSARAASASSSPFGSRESSPVRPPLKSNTPSARTTGPGRSRKNSVQDISPSRVPTSANPPSAAAATTQRALSSTSTPSLLPANPEPGLRIAPQKPAPTSEIRETPRWPLSPRLRSPPPTNKHSIISPRKADQETPSINVPRPEQPEGRQSTTDTDSEDLPSITGMRTPVRGASGSTLETVQEISLPNTPGPGLDGLLEKAHNGRLADQDTAIENAFNKNLKSRGSIVANESGSDSGGKSETKLRSASLTPAGSSRPGGPPVKSYSATIGAGRGKPTSDGITRNMTVETETVSSIPQVAVGGVGGGNNGSIRTKLSSETIRPKKEKKKTARKTPSVNAGTASSKADIFEAKVAIAVDEANSSDSEETFVYESNPPDVNDRPRRFHSRTPSVTSMASQADQRSGMRSMMDTGHSVAMKKSMKFANSYNSNVPEATATEDDGKGTARSNLGTGRGTTHHHHIGRWGRNGGNGHPSLFDNESPFPNAAKSKMAGNGNGNANGSRHSPQPSSPRGGSRGTPYGGKKSSQISGYDIDDRADDERTPLISTIRSGRSGRNRRPLSSLRQLEHQAARHNKSFFARFAGCIVISLMIIMVFAGALGFMFATTQPLTEVKVMALKNVIASEQEVIFDMRVTARNKNIVAVIIDTAELAVFAKSKYGGTNSEWWRRPPERRARRRGIAQKRDDDFTDPPGLGDPARVPNFDIGEVDELKSPLIFEGSPFHAVHSTSMCQIRITNPGNTTLPSGSERWGRIVEHEFDLIVRGTLKYTLPLAQRVRSVSVEGRVTVKPNAADQDPDNLQPRLDVSDMDIQIIG